MGPSWRQSKGLLLCCILMVMIIIILWKSSFDLVSSYKFSWGKSYTITSWYVCFVISSFPCILPLNIYRCLFVRVCFCFLILRASVLVHCSRVIVSLRPLVVVAWWCLLLFIRRHWMCVVVNEEVLGLFVCSLWQDLYMFVVCDHKLL